jgi:hypothetical protein
MPRMRVASALGTGHSAALAVRLVLSVSLAAGLASPALAQAPMSHDQPQPGAREYPSLRISGFGDVNFATTKHPEGARGFFEGQLTLHMTSELSPRAFFFGEISFTPRSDAGTGSPAATGFNVEVERMIIRFDRNDRLKVSLGRYHTPVNYWNTAFHHGQWLQTTITRPEMIQFGGRVLPVHFVGALVEGSVPAGGWNLSYKGGVGNGRSSVISRGGDAGDVNGHRSWLGNVYVKPDALYGLQAGGAVYGDRITLANGREFTETILAAHVVWQKETPEILAEFAAVGHDERGVGGGTRWTPAFYVQVAHRLPVGDRLWKPYFRFEHIDIDNFDGVFAGVPSLDMATAGFRYDASLLAALKAEYRTWTRGTGSVRNHGFFGQVCFTF